MNIKKLYKDAFKIHFVELGFPEFEAELKAEEIVLSMKICL